PRVVLEQLCCVRLGADAHHPAGAAQDAPAAEQPNSEPDDLFRLLQSEDLSFEARHYARRSFLSERFAAAQLRLELLAERRGHRGPIAVLAEIAHACRAA